MKTTVAYAPAPSTSKFAPRPKSKGLFMDDAAAREVHLRVVDPLAEIRDTLLCALNEASRSTYEEPGRSRKQARQLVLKAWQELAVVARELAAPVPKFRPNLNGPRPVVRHRQADEEVADLRSVPVPAWASEVAR